LGTTGMVKTLAIKKSVQNEQYPASITFAGGFFSRNFMQVTVS